MQAIPIASLGAASGPYRDVTGHTASGAPDGYVYRQYPDGTVVIVKSPRGSSNVTVTEAGNPSAWAAITKEIGPYPNTKLSPAQIAKIWVSTATAASAAIQALSAANRPHTGRKKAPAPLPVQAPVESTTPGWLVPAALVAGGVGILYLFTRKDSHA
jgi:hypothetical protein